MNEIVVPMTPGVLSALGGLIADTKNDFVKTTYYNLDVTTLRQLDRDRTELEQVARDWIREEIGSDADAQLSLSADMRYRGQSFEIDTPLSLAALAAGNLAAVRDAFHREHEKLYGHSDDAAMVQVIALRLVISAPTLKPVLEALEEANDPPQPLRQVTAYMDGAFQEVPLYQRSTLRATQRFAGPAVVVQDDTTTCVLPGYTVTVDRHGNLVIKAARVNNAAI
jgi:N-methylhydantoinase A